MTGAEVSGARVWSWLMAAALFLMPANAHALTVKDAILYVLETHPEIQAAEANKQAIEFEMEQARGFRTPRVELEAWGGWSSNRGTTSSDLGAALDTIDGYEVSARISQMLFDGWETRSEIERQAYRIDSAAQRLLERSEVLALDAVRVYSDVLRSRALLQLARENVTYHTEIYDQLKNGYDRGVIGIGDLQQAEERVFLAKDTVLDFEMNFEDVKTMFIAVVGVEANKLGNVPDLRGSVPGSLEVALQKARQFNPVIKLMQSDVGAAEALSRRANANQFPTLHLEADARYGEDVGGFEGKRDDFRLGLFLRYDFQGGVKRAERQEQARRVNESRSHLLSQTRRVEAEVRNSWNTLQAAQRRLKTIGAQASLSRKLRDAYAAEYIVGSRSLLDVLNTQGALFQAEANLINARSLEVYVKYRLLASVGILLPSLNIPIPEDAKPYAGARVGAPPLSEFSSEQQFDASTFRDWRKSLDQ